MSKYNVGVYIRLSRDDNYSDSNSIDNQIKLIEFYCKNNDLKTAEKYIDNGYRKAPKRNKTNNVDDILSVYFKCKDCSGSMYIKKEKINCMMKY